MHKSIYGISAVLAAAYLAAIPNTARAADLGGGCCGELEDRVAELEATTARKGNRTVSLTISGQVSRALLIWDDGVKSDAYVVDNAINTSRFAMEGKAQIRPGLTAGYVMQIDINDALSSIVSQTNDEGFGESSIVIRVNNVYIESDTLGKVSLGQNYSFNDAISVPLQVANTYNTDGAPYADGFRVMTTAGHSSGISFEQLLGDGPRRNDYVRYDSPVFGGFGFTALWGDNNVWDVGGKYIGKVGRFQLNTAIDYFHYNAEPLGAAGLLSEFADLKGLISVKDMPSGVFLTAWATKRDYNRVFLGNEIDETGHAIQVLAGVEKNFFGPGNLTVYGGYGQFTNMAATGLSASAIGLDVGGDKNNSADDFVTDSKVNRLTFGIIQTFDAAALDVYAIAEHYSTDITVGDLGSTAKAKADLEDFNAVIIGSRIKF